MYEEEAKTGKEYDDLRGLGALLFDDGVSFLLLKRYHSRSGFPLAAPEVKHEPNDVEKTLSALGVQYTHRNDDLIAENAIEGQRMRRLLEVCSATPADMFTQLTQN